MEPSLMFRGDQEHASHLGVVAHTWCAAGLITGVGHVRSQTQPLTFNGSSGRRVIHTLWTSTLLLATRFRSLLPGRLPKRRWECTPIADTPLFEQPGNHVSPKRTRGMSRVPWSREMSCPERTKMVTEPHMAKVGAVFRGTHPDERASEGFSSWLPGPKDTCQTRKFPHFRGLGKKKQKKATLIPRVG